MRVKIFTLNENNKIEFTQKELEKLLDEVYEDGVADGKKSNYFYYRYPYTTTTTDATTINSDSISVKPGTTAGTVAHNIPSSTDCSCTGCKK